MVLTRVTADACTDTLWDVTLNVCTGTLWHLTLLMHVSVRVHSVNNVPSQVRTLIDRKSQARHETILGDLVPFWAVLAWVRSQNTRTLQVPWWVRNII